MKKVLILFAQFSEAKHLIAKTSALPIEGRSISVWSEGVQNACYQFDSGMIAITNVGLHAAQMAAAKYGQEFDEIWNGGFAGTLKPTLSLFEIIPIETVGKYIPLSETLDPTSQDCLASTLPHLKLNPEGKRLISSDFPVHQNREALTDLWDLVDMEGYGIAFAAANLNKKCRMWKIVSDFASPHGRELIRKHKNELAEKIADKIIENL